MSSGSAATVRACGRLQGGTMLSTRQEQVLEFVLAGVARHGYPPSIREIGDAVGLRSTSSVAYQLKVLQEKGYLQRDRGRPRTMELLPSEPPAAPEELSGMSAPSVPS